MNLKKRCFVIAGIAALGISSSTTTQATTRPQESVIGSVQAQASSVNQKNATFLARKIGEVEVERTLQLVRFTSETPMIKELDKRYAELMVQLKQIEPNRYRTSAALATQAALRSEIAKLQAEYQRDDQRFTPDTPMQQVRQAQISSLKQRLTEILKHSS